MNKPFYRSRTLWVNFLALLAFVLQYQFGFVLPVEIQASILAIANFLIRFDTSVPVSF